MKLLHVCVGQARAVRINGRKVMTAIAKTATANTVPVAPLGLQGDEQADHSVHGGPAKAVYAYPSEHVAYWQQQRGDAGVALWDEPLPPGFFGENLLLQGVLEDALWVGDRLVLPNCVLTVSEPRFPCFKFTAVMGFALAAKRMVQSGTCGSYLSVTEPGSVQAGQPFTLEPGPRQVNIRKLFASRMRQA